MKILGKLHPERLSTQDNLSIGQDQQEEHKEERPIGTKDVVVFGATMVHLGQLLFSLFTRTRPNGLRNSVYILTDLGQLLFSLFTEIA